MEDPHEGHRLRRRTASACPVYSGHTQYTRRGHSVPEMCLQRCCKIPVMFPVVIGLGHGGYQSILVRTSIPRGSEKQRYVAL